ncbi:MAG: energy transducer TonB [Holophagaceae bacterium]|nr:energy transducer TonB [Holophagaceae bacterium]
MGNALSTSALSVPLGEQPRISSFPTPSAVQPAQARPDVPEPPSLGTLPRGPRTRVLTLSVAVYGALLSGALAFAVVPPVKEAPLRAVTVALDAFEDQAPPPPSAGLERPSHASTAAPRSEETAPVPTPEEPRPAIEPTAAPASTLTHGIGQPDGVPGGQAGAVSAGVPGAQAGGVPAVSLGAVVPPRFDAAYLQNPEPGYPLVSKRLGEEGKVLLRVLVNPEGLAEQVEVRQSSGHPRLDQAALGTVRRWRFTPARRGADRLAAWVLVPLSFQLDA